ncbi:hypothetical protein P167DRAFT_580584 [Morchella conica CCBAS932]|uniref:DUF4219 domain-containing protein n=1 Tax=Morchella conica CCBAS932 TaxID=1392247 RepID=A0A3N4KAL2_9PEZI|nr:hypothetical protein P167DRAFT_580584 [Morchella conica CCBAS932]
MSERSIEIPALLCKLDCQSHYTVWKDIASRMLKAHDMWNLFNRSSKDTVLTTTTTVKKHAVYERNLGVAKGDKGSEGYEGNNEGKRYLGESDDDGNTHLETADLTWHSIKTPRSLMVTSRIPGVAKENADEDISDNAEGISEWDKKNNLAVVFLQSNIEFEVILTLILANPAHYIWSQLEDRFDRKTIAFLHSLLANVVTLQYTPDKDI